MLSTQAYAQPDPALRILTNRALIARLRSRRLLSYSGLAEYMINFHLVAHFLKLWQTFFPEVPLPDSKDRDLLNVSAGFMHLVDDYLFPIEWDYLDGLYNSSDGDVAYVAQADIPFRSWGFELDETSFVDQDEWSLPLLAMLDLGEGIDWWEMYGPGEWPEDGFALARNTDLGSRLRELPAPFDGLEGVYKAIRGDTGNPFFDVVDVNWRGILEFPEFYWTEDGVRTLAREYARAKPVIDRMTSYIEWFYATERHSQGEATRQVVATLMRLEEEHGNTD